MNDMDARRRNHWVNHIARHAHEKPGAVYLRFEGVSITWSQLHVRVAGVAGALRRRGVRAGDRVAIMMTNRPEFLETMLAANALGAIVVPVNFRLAPEEIASIGAIAPMLLIGGTTVLLPSGGFTSAAALDLMEAERITSVFLVPAQWQLLCADPSLASRDLSALKIMSWGAAPATTTLLTRMAEAFPGVTNVAVFGQTEMSPVTCALSGTDALRKIGSVGQPVSIVAARIVDDGMKDVPPGEVGEIVYRGPSVMSGYWQNPEATAEAFRGGWFHSGDLVRADEEGFLYVVDRKKDMIITGGENVYCAEVENALAAHPAVAELAVIGTPHDRWGETPAAIAVLLPGASLTLGELREWGTARLARYKLPTVLHVMDGLPRNASGKVMKSALRGQFG
jgi:fatty-acyl-CoA synthase